MFYYNENATKEKWLLKNYEKSHNVQLDKFKYLVYEFFKPNVVWSFTYATLDDVLFSFTAADKELIYRRITELEENYPGKKYLILSEYKGKISRYIGASIRPS